MLFSKRISAWLTTLLAIFLFTGGAWGLPQPAQKSCSGSDYTGGIGGQDVTCEFTCDENSTITLKVDAVDPDADVAGNVACGTYTAGCTGKQKCSESGLTTAQGAGTCEGHSSEAWDSGLAVTCSSEVGNKPGSPTAGWCPVTSPVEVCFGAIAGCVHHVVCQEPSHCSVVGSQCVVINQILGQELPDMDTPKDPIPFEPIPIERQSSSWTSVTILFGKSQVVAFTCDVYGCEQVTPDCRPEGRGLTCSVGLMGGE